ncbi:MAG: DNA primase [Clostridiales bacterium]|nr:DNA primase [Clostridiales bacterium]
MSNSGINRTIPDELVEEVKSRNDIVSVVGQYVRLDKRSSANLFGLCPFHNEDTPSFSVSPSKQIFYCFGCHKGGNVITFIREIEKCTWPQALKILADRVGIQLPEPDDAAYRERLERNATLQKIYLEAARYYYHSLQSPAGATARRYLKERAIADSTARKFGLGFAPDEWDGLLLHLRRQGLDDPQLISQSGLFKRGKSDGYYDLFRNRLMFPIFDAMGKIIAFGGRVLDDSQPKYLNSPETPLYTKGRHLYGLNLAKSSSDKRLVLVEGYMDTLAMHQAGIDNAVAALGTAMTEAQANLIRKYTDQVIVGFDADAAGQNAALRSLDILTSRGLKVTVLRVPDGKDPDEFIRKHGPERFKVLIDQALPLLDFKLDVARRSCEVHGALDILAFQDQACSILAREDNAIVRELYAGKVSEWLHASADSVVREIERRREGSETSPGGDLLHQQLAARKKPDAPPVADLAQPSGQQATREEIYLLCFLAEHPTLWARLEPKPVAADFSAGVMQAVASRLLEYLDSGKSVDSGGLMLWSEALVVHGRLLTDLLAKASMKLEETFAGQDPLKTIHELVRTIRLENLRRQLRETAALAQDPDQPAEAAEARKKLLDINQQIQKLRTR